MCVPCGHIGTTWKIWFKLCFLSAHPSPQPKWQIDQLSRFWATVSKTVSPMLSDHCPVCLCPVLLSVMLVYCGQTVGWIKMKLGMQVGLGPGHIVVDGDPAPFPPKGHSLLFSVHVYCHQMFAHLSYCWACVYRVMLTLTLTLTLMLTIFLTLTL